MNRSEPLPFYLDKTKAHKYLEMREGLDGRILVEHLRSVLKNGSSVLELGMGPGSDLLLLARHFRVVGSDYSPHFIKAFEKSHSGFKLELLDAVSIETDSVFDCIYSNKVLHHLELDQMRASLQRQIEVVRPGGVLMHSFWLGNDTACSEGMIFKKNKRGLIVDLLSGAGRITKSGTYTEMNSKDSFFVAVQTFV